MPLEDRISTLPEDLLVQILSHIPIEDAVTTMVLSKRWRSLWTMVPNLDYTDTCEDEKSIWDFLDKSMQQHRAPFLESLSIELGEHCPVDANVGKWISEAVDNRRVRELVLLFHFLETVDPIKLPESLYTCKTLVYLTLSDKILVDVPSSVCLPSLESLDLLSVVYKNQDSQVRLLSSCPVLKDLVVVRTDFDNVAKFDVKVPSLLRLTYMNEMSMEDADSRSFVIDSPGLTHVEIEDPLGEYCSFQNMPGLDVAIVKVGSRFGSHPNDGFLEYFSSVMFLNLAMTDVAFCSGISFSWLVELELCPDYQDHKNWFESLTVLLHNSPILRVLMINPSCNVHCPLLWNQPSSVPGCLLSHLEIFEWNGYSRAREERQFVAYILANSNCL